MRFSVRILLTCGLIGLSNLAYSSCGSTFCMVNTNWNLQGFAPERGLRADFRFEYIDQDQPMFGGKRVGIGEISRHHDEVSTINRNYVISFDYNFDNAWGLSATLPLADRSHMHNHNHHGVKLSEQWDFSEIGDIRMLGRRQWAEQNSQGAKMSFYGINFGLKLPTGRIDVKNEDGELAERTLQPGTGTTDLLIGAYYSRLLVDRGSSWFVQGLAQLALNSHHDYKPGDRLSIDFGYRREINDSLGLMLQLNYLHRARDSGLDAEPEDSGGRFLFLSPGASYAFTKKAQVYGFVQLPLYQYVNGVQLTADWSAVFGVSVRF